MVDKIIDPIAAISPLLAVIVILLLFAIRYLYKEKEKLEEKIEKLNEDNNKELNAKDDIIRSLHESMRIDSKEQLAVFKDMPIVLDRIYSKIKYIPDSVELKRLRQEEDDFGGSHQGGRR